MTKIDDMTKEEILQLIATIDSKQESFQTYYSQILFIVNQLRRLGLPTNIERLIEINQKMLNKLEAMKEGLE